MQLILVQNPLEGLTKAKEILQKEVDKKTVLFLSGGRTPKELYEKLATEQKLLPGAVGLIDERYGPPAIASEALRAGPKGHENSNEKMIEESGLLHYLEQKRIPFYPILQPSVIASPAKRDEAISREPTAHAYDTTVRDLLFKFPKSVGILGIGLDGHTAGIPTNGRELGITNKELEEKDHNSYFLIHNSNEADIYNTSKLVDSYDDSTGKYGERVTMTFTALSMLDTLIVVVLGKDKADALKKSFQPGSLSEIPARFYQQPEISKKTILITDQRI